MFRAAKIEVLKYIHSFCTSPQASPFSIAELNSCISDLDGSAASGLDQVTNLMLINLDKSNKQELLALYNLSWKLGVSPKEWTCGLKIPLPKPGKDKSLLESYSPVCLMSVIAKLMEKLVCTRLVYDHDLESRSVLSPC